MSTLELRDLVFKILETGALFGVVGLILFHLSPRQANKNNFVWMIFVLTSLIGGVVTVFVSSIIMIWV